MRRDWCRGGPSRARLALLPEYASPQMVKRTAGSGWREPFGSLARLGLHYLLPRHQPLQSTEQLSHNVEYEAGCVIWKYVYTAGRADLKFLFSIPHQANIAARLMLYSPANLASTTPNTQLLYMHCPV